MKSTRTKKSLMLLLAIVMCLSTLFSAGFAADDDTKDELAGWTLGDGFSVTSTWVYEGSYAMEHNGAESQAVSEEITLEDGVTYYVSAYVRRADADAAVTVNFDGFDLKSTKTGKWEELSVNVAGDGQAHKITVTATGTAQIDGISIRPFKEGEELIQNGDFATSGWSGMTWVSEYKGHEGVVRGDAANGIQVSSGSAVTVEQNSYYLYAADFYVEENGPWLYADMNDAAGEVQIRGTKTGEWQTVSGVWSSGSNTSTAIRLVKEPNWDDPTSSANVTGAGYIDNVSLKKITLYEDLIGDGGFEKYVSGEAKDDWTYVNNTDESINYGEGSKGGGGGAGYYNGDETHMYGETTYTFTGTGIRWMAAKNVDCGVAEVSIDDGTVETVDLYNSSLITGVVYEKKGLSEGEHTIKIVNTNVEGRPYVPMDALQILTGTKQENAVASGWKLNDGASIQEESHYLFGKQSLKLTNTASAVANNGAVIDVEPNCYYYFSAWRLRPGTKDVDGSIVIKSADGKTDIASITGSRYNQTMWNPANGTNYAEKQIGQWEQIFGFWNSGENTKVTLWAESEGTGVFISMT